jgi:hypothetical protein
MIRARFIHRALAAGVFLLVLSACGKRPDDVDPPPGADPGAYPRAYPDVQLDPPGTATP